MYKACGSLVLGWRRPSAVDHDHETTALDLFFQFSVLFPINHLLCAFRVIFALFLILEIQPQGRSVLKILPYYSLYKMANFGTFQKRVIFRILSLYLSFFCVE